MIVAPTNHQSKRVAPGEGKWSNMKGNRIFIHPFRREALRSLLAVSVIAVIILSSSYAANAHQAADQVEQLIQQQVDQDSFAFPYGADNDQSLIPVQQQQLNGNFGNRPSSRPVRPDFSSFGLRPTTSTTTESSQQQQQQNEDAEQQQQEQQTGNGQQDGQEQIVQQNNLDGNEEQVVTQAPLTTRKPTKPSGFGGNANQQQQQRPSGQRPIGGSRPRPTSTTTTSTTTTTTEQPIQVAQVDDESSQGTQTGNGDGENTNSLDNSNDGQQQQQLDENNANLNGNQGTSTRSPNSQGSQSRPIGGESTGTELPSRPTGGRPSTDGTGNQQQLQEELQQVVDGGNEDTGNNSQDSGNNSNNNNNETDDNNGNNGSTSDEENSQQQQQVDNKPNTPSRLPNQRPLPTRAPISSTTVTTTTTTPSPISQQNGGQEIDNQFEGGNNNQEENQDSNGQQQQQQQQQQDESGNEEQDTSSQAPTTPSTTTSTTTTTTTARLPIQGGKSGSRPRGQHVPLKGKPMATPMNFVNQQRQNSQPTNGLTSSGNSQGPIKPNGQKGSSKPIKGTRRPTITSGINSHQQQLTNDGQDQQQPIQSGNGNGGSVRQTTESPIVQQNNLSGEEESQTGNERPSIPSSRPISSGTQQGQNRPQGTTNGQSNQQRPIGSRPTGLRPRPTSTTSTSTSTTTTTTTEQPIQVTQGEDETSQLGNEDTENTNSNDNNNINNNNNNVNSNDNQEQQQLQQQQQENNTDVSTRAPSSGTENGSRPNSGSLNGSNNLSGGDTSLNRPNGGRPVSQQQEELQQVVNGGDTESETGSQDSGNGGSTGGSTGEGDESSSGNGTGTGTSSDDEEQQKVDILSVTSTTSTRKPFNQRPIFPQRPSTTTTTTTTTTTPVSISQQNGSENDGQFDQNITQENTNGSGIGSGAEGQENVDDNENVNNLPSQQPISTTSSTTTTRAPTTSAATTRRPVSGQQSKGNPRGSSLKTSSPITGQRQATGASSSSEKGSRTSTQLRVPTTTSSSAPLTSDKKGSSRPSSRETFVVQPAVSGQTNLIVPGPFMQPLQAQFPEAVGQQQVIVDGGFNEELSQQQVPALQPAQGPRFVMVPMAMRQQILDFAQQQNLIPPQSPIFLGPQISEQQQMMQQQIIQQQLLSGPLVEPTFKSRPPKPIIGGSFQQSTKTVNKPSSASTPSRFAAQQQVSTGGVSGPINGVQTNGQPGTKQGPRRLSWMTNLLPANQANQQQALKQTLTPSSQSRQPSNSGLVNQSAGARRGTKQQPTFSSLGQQQTLTSTNQLPVSSGIQSSARATKTQQVQQLQESLPTGSINNGRQTTNNGVRAGLSNGTKDRRPLANQSTGVQLKPTLGLASTSGQLVNDQRQTQLVTGAGNGNVFTKGSMRPLKPVTQGQQIVSPATTSGGVKSQSTTGVSQQQSTGSDVSRPSVNQLDSGSQSFNGLSDNQQSNNSGFPQRASQSTSQGATKGGRSKQVSGINSPRSQASRMSPGAKSRLATKNLLAQQLLTN